MNYYCVICHFASGIVNTAGRWSGWLVLFSNTEVNWYKVQIYGAIGSSRGKANTHKEYSTDGQSLFSWCVWIHV